MNTRKIKKAVKRLSNLPRGKYLLLYLQNKAKTYNLKRSKSLKVAFPSTIMLELTNHCNLACTTCPREYAFGKAMDKGYMSLASAKKIIDELWIYLDSIGLTGMGETFLYKDIAEVVDYIKLKNKGIIISVSTNAVLPNFIERVAGLLGKIDTIQVSIDGLGEIYNTIRKKSDFTILDANLRKLVQLAKNTDTDIMLNMVVTKENYTHIPLLVSYAKEVGIKYLDYSMFNLASLTEHDKSYYHFYQSPEFISKLLELENIIKSTPEVIVRERNFRTDNSFRKCPFPWTHFYISWDGYMPPCCAKPFPKELHFGNVFENSVINTLNSKEYQNFRQKWMNNTPPSFCNKCHYLGVDTDN